MVLNAFCLFWVIVLVVDDPWPETELSNSDQIVSLQNDLVVWKLNYALSSPKTKPSPFPNSVTLVIYVFFSYSKVFLYFINKQLMGCFGFIASVQATFSQNLWNLAIWFLETKLVFLCHWWSPTQSVSMNPIMVNKQRDGASRKWQTFNGFLYSFFLLFQQIDSSTCGCIYSCIQVPWGCS